MVQISEFAQWRDPDAGPSISESSADLKWRPGMTAKESKAKKALEERTKRSRVHVKEAEFSRVPDPQASLCTVLLLGDSSTVVGWLNG